MSGKLKHLNMHINAIFFEVFKMQCSFPAEWLSTLN